VTESRQAGISVLFASGTRRLTNVSLDLFNSMARSQRLGQICVFRQQISCTATIVSSTRFGEFYHKDIIPELATSMIQQVTGKYRSTRQETRPMFPSSSYLDVSAHIGLYASSCSQDYCQWLMARGRGTTIHTQFSSRQYNLCFACKGTSTDDNHW
jgi:hypothetical protein